MNTLNLFSVEISSPLFTETLTYETGGYGGVGYYHGNIASASFSYYSGGPAAYQTLYQYDNLGRLKIADNNITALNPYDISNISYDLNGNIISINRGGTNYTYNYYTGTNKLKNTGGSNNDYEYDLNGNIKKSLPKGLDPLVYDPFTQMTKSITVTGTPSKTMSFNYSADNERVLKTESSGTTKNSNLYIRGNNNYPITEKINLTSVLNDKIYIYGPTGLIAFKDATATYYVIKDHLGSTRVLFRNTGSYYTTYDYSPFGSLMRATINGDVDYRFTGQEFDSETALYNFRARLYDDELGIFYAVDPSGQNFAPFSYAGNNPIIFVDKDGRWFIIDDLFVAVTSFVYGYFSHAISTGEWGGQALTSGAISAGVSWLAYNTGGAVAGLFFDATTSSAGYSIVSSAVGSAVGGFTGSTINQLRYEGSVDWNQSLRSGIAGLGGGLIGGASEFYSSSLIDKFPFEHTMSHFIRSSGYQIGSNLILGNHPFENFDAGWGSAALPFWLDVGEIGANLFIKLEYARRADENGVIGGVTDVFGEKIGYGIAQDLWGKFNLGIDWEGIHLFEIFGPAGLGVGTASDQLIATSYVNIDLGFRLAGSSTGFNSLFHRSTLNNYWLYYQNYWR